MFLTHIDPTGQDSPAILVENATAANRAVNIPEFVNIPPGGLLKIDAPATEFYRVFDLATELAGKGQYNEAISEWKKALELSPEDAKVHNNFGAALAKQGRIDEAIPHFEKALAANPNSAQLHYNLGRSLATKGKLDEAIPHFEQAVKLSGGLEPAVLDTLAAIYAEVGRFPEAVQTARQALELATQQNNQGLAATLNARIALYESRTPIRGGQLSSPSPSRP